MVVGGVFVFVCWKIGFVGRLSECYLGLWFVMFVFMVLILVVWCVVGVIIVLFCVVVVGEVGELCVGVDEVVLLFVC